MPGWNNRGNEKPQFIWKPGMKEPLLIFNVISGNFKTGNTLNCSPFASNVARKTAYIYNAQIWEERANYFFGQRKNGLYVIRTLFYALYAQTPLLKQEEQNMHKGRNYTGNDHYRVRVFFFTTE